MLFVGALDGSYCNIARATGLRVLHPDDHHPDTFAVVAIFSGRVMVLSKWDDEDAAYDRLDELAKSVNAL